MHNNCRYVGFHEVPRAVSDPVGYVKAIFTLHAPRMYSVAGEIMVLWGAFHAEKRRITLRPLATTAPPAYKAPNQRVMMEYVYGTFSATYGDDDGRMRTAIRRHVMLNHHEDEKSQIMMAGSLKQDWIAALNAMNFFAFFDREEQAVEWFVEKLVAVGLRIEPERCSIQYSIVLERRVLTKLTLVFTEGDAAGALQEAAATYDGDVVELAGIHGDWISKKKYAVYEDALAQPALQNEGCWYGGEY